MMSHLKIHTIIVAAGSGSRFGANMPKQYCNLNGRPVLMHTIDAIRSATDNADITLVLSHDMRSFWSELCEQHNFASPTVVDGGATRWHSVKNAVSAISDNGADIIMVHDGARPIVDVDMMQRLIAATTECGAAIPAIAVTDSLRQVAEPQANIGKAVDRSLYRAVQTPQAFKADLLIAAYNLPYTTMFTDDASVVEAAGNTVVMVEGSPKNIKITNPGDIDIAALLLTH
jgi:2-C-methyl-D-erythritol 4-phosphate cytidylyltransferase